MELRLRYNSNIIIKLFRSHFTIHSTYETKSLISMLLINIAKCAQMEQDKAKVLEKLKTSVREKDL